MRYTLYDALREEVGLHVERETQRDWARDVLDLEATLQAKDAQIAALVNGILDIDEWMSGRSSHICPFCKQAIDEGHKADCLRGIAAAIKEATI